MAVRTTQGAVEEILGDDYDTVKSPSLLARIRTASNIVTRVIACAAESGQTFTTDEAKDLETWLAAWLYAMSDKPYTSRSTLGASGSFAGQTGMGLDANLYGQTAKLLDFTGCLESVLGKTEMGLDWLGKVESDWISPDERSTD